MKTKSFIALFLSLLCGSLLAQPFGKIDSDLQNRIQTNSDEQLYPVLVCMTQKYDEVRLQHSTELMTKAQRRAFVISDRQAFCQNAQREVLDFLNSYQDERFVTEVKPFWSFNGFGCKANAEVIRQLAERRDVAWIVLDEERPMIPQGERPRPMTAKELAWHVEKVNAPSVWNYNGTGYTGNGVVVALIDTGVNYNHVDISNSMWDGGSEFPHHGYDIYNQDNDPMDDHGHGSHTAGIVAGQGNAGTQTGVAPGAKIMALKMLGAEGEGSDAQLIESVEFALAHGADVISLSLGESGIGACGFYREVFETALDAGVAASTAAGNDGQIQYTYPIPNNVNAPGNCPPPWLHPDQKNLVEGGLTAVISVGATNSNDSHCDFSSVGPVTWAYGENVGEYNDYPYQNGDATQPGLIRPDISAPGENITSLNYANNNGYVVFDGTSMATPCVTGVLALLLEANPELTPAELDSIIELTSVRVGNSKKDNRVGAGRIDALAAVNALFYHGPTQLTATLDGDEVMLEWTAPEQAVSFTLYRDGMPIANALTSNEFVDHLNYGGDYTYYVTALLDNGMTSLPSNYVTINKEVSVEAEVINDQRVALEWNLPAGLYDGFESGDFYQNMWINDATSPWTISTNQPNEGTYCAKSTNTGMFSTSKISLGVNVATSSVVSYYARISCFPLNGGGFFIDNVQYGETIKDEVPWTHYSVALSPGNHLLEWKYGNQLAEGEYENAFYIDDIRVGNAFDVYRADCDGQHQVQIASAVAQANYVDYDWAELPAGLYKYGVSTDGGVSMAWSECLEKKTDGVDDEGMESLQLYPNPAQNQLTIVGENLQQVTVMTLQGQVLYDIKTTENTMAISLDDLPSGLYFVTIRTQNGTATRQFSVIK